ncbi:MAG: ACT domain-containing protein [Clostridia bacterium]|nr:ACT domain-containing protein [Clostridia bacterium]
MAIRQLSVFIPNKPGKLAELTKLFFDEGFDIRAISVYDTADFGILRTVVSNPDKALATLAENGVVAKMSDVLAVNPEDRRGSLNEVFTILANEGISIEYVYSFVVEKGQDQYFVLQVGDIEKAEKALESHSVEVIRDI